MFRKRFAIGMVVLAVCSGLYGAASGRPNIVFAFADDWGRYAGIYAQISQAPLAADVIRTPNIDRLARAGVVFRNAHVTAPSCTPCRSSLLSGQYFWRTGRGAILQGAQWDETIPTYPLLLRDAGYHIGKSYKVWSPGQPADAPYGGQRYAWEASGRDFNQFSQTATRLIGQGIEREAAKQRIYNQVRGNFVSFLDACGQDQPFCYWFGPTNTHRKWIRGSGRALWDIDPDDLKGKLPQFLPDVPEVREDFADYLGEAMAFDAAVGILLEELDKRGELANTLFVISGDHGAPGFPHGKCNLYDFGTGVALAIAGPGIPPGRVVDDFVNLTDLAPTFLEAGGVTVPAVMTGRSLMPLLRSGKSGQVESRRTWVVTGRERHVATAREGQLPCPQRALRTSEYRFIINFAPDRTPMGDPYRLAEGEASPTAAELTEDTYVTYRDMDASPTKAWLVGQRDNPLWKQHYDWAFAKRPREELYDLKNDPDQIRNLAADPAYAAIVSRLRDQLMTELKTTGDPRAGDDPIYDHPPYAGPLNDGNR